MRIIDSFFRVNFIGINQLYKEKENKLNNFGLKQSILELHKFLKLRYAYIIPQLSYHEDAMEHATPNK